jgi:hypothetical protein
MSDIFISYAREDLTAAQRLAEALEGHGWSVWWDRRILPGKDFEKVIEAKLDASRCVVVIWSKAAVDSHFVRDEAAEGMRRNILVPVCPSSK